jgi:tRNA (mo5U34)-methyltransferase
LRDRLARVTEPASEADACGLRFRPAWPISARKRDPQSAAEFLNDFDAAFEEGRSRSAADGAAGAGSPEQPSLAERVAAMWWYHTIELGDGVVSSGMFDHRPLVPHYGIPDSLEGKRCLDIACSDGFWAFEFERRGGAVTGVDVATRFEWDWPTGTVVPERKDTLDTFEVAREALGSGVRRVMRSIYALDPDELGGPFDFVHSGDVLLHLERPLEALRCFRRMVADDGVALIGDAIDPDLSDPTLTRYYGGFDLIWFLPSLDCLVQMVYDAGFSDVEVVSIYNIPPWNQHAGLWRAALKATP